ncbi:hypothetical protein N0V83_005443 [Neocucurbitaria cava]|uniref:Uncharacterized protein n=1 Tax=Neocucurbitaria cava TaxID=798079 RepID=A0A9W8Y7X8_9PLEO|nr:hypothetical protein N0V83_005443 [Neocucurbitaria cava]
MSALYPTAPPGIDAEVLSQIDTFMAHTSPRRNAIVRRNDTQVLTQTTLTTDVDPSNEEQYYPQGYRPESAPNNGDSVTTILADEKSYPPGHYPESESASESGSDSSEEEYYDAESTAQEEYEVPKPKIIARYTYPSEHRPRPLPSTPPPQPSLLNRVTTYISAIFFAPQPAIIEYTPEEIAQQIQVRIEARKVEYHSSSSSSSSSRSSSSSSSSSSSGEDGGNGGDGGKVVRVIAIVKNDVKKRGGGGGTVTGAGDEVVDGKVGIFEIKARHRRVREIWKDSGMRGGAEEVYGNEIRGALRKLKGV